MDIDFPNWLLEELKKRGWSQADLANSAGINRQVVSTYLNRQRKNPEPEVLNSIARALKLPPETVFRAAGLLPEAPEETEESEELRHLAGELPEDKRRQLLEYARFLLAQAEADEKRKKR